MFGVKRYSPKYRRERVPFAQEVGEGNLLEDGANDGSGLEGGGGALDEGRHDAQIGERREAGETWAHSTGFLHISAVSPGVTGHVRR